MQLIQLNVSKSESTNFSATVTHKQPGYEYIWVFHKFSVITLTETSDFSVNGRYL